MRLVMRWAACICIALFAAGCDPTRTQGVGTTLYPADVTTQTELQNAYVAEICQQAGLPAAIFDGVTSCGANPYDAATWWLFVQAGMNDIDQRCDSYLAWLDGVQRSREPVLNELALLSATSISVMRATGVGVNPIAIVGAAFGLASGTFTNVYSRLIITMPHSTIQALVLSRQKEYRDRLAGTSTTKPIAIVSRPAALYALRSYLRLCMPMTIETEINSTIATFERNGADGLRKDSLISPRSAGIPFTPSSTTQKPGRAPVEPPDADVAQFFKETNLSKTETEFTLRGLCFEKNTQSGPTRRELIRQLVAIFEATPVGSATADEKPVMDGIISANERRLINKQPDCGAAMNYFEKFNFANTVSQPDNNEFNLAEYVKLLRRVPAGSTLPENTPFADRKLRDAIAAARATLGQNDAPAATQATFALGTAIKTKFPKAN